jgi:hypothetical protein
MTDAEIAGLLRDALRLWGVEGTVAACDGGLVVTTGAGMHVVSRGTAPTRWFLQTPARAEAGRPPRAAASVTGLLTALRNALGGAAAGRVPIGSGAAPA